MLMKRESRQIKRLTPVAPPSSRGVACPVAWTANFCWGEEPFTRLKRPRSVFLNSELYRVATACWFQVEPAPRGS